jgi:ABC-2 type transport system ATP-binding protein
VRSLDHRGDQFTLVSDDSDATLRFLLAAHDDIHDIEVTAHTMDDAFLALTEGSASLAASEGSASLAASDGTASPAIPATPITIANGAQR